MRRLVLLGAAVLMMGLGLSVADSEAADSEAADSETGAPTPARVTFVQAVPGVAVSMSVDGREMVSDAAVGEVLGPFDLAAGTYDLTFSGAGLDVQSTLEVAAGEVSDVVLHLPAEVGGEPVVRSFQAPTGAIGPGKARVMLAHTATVAPADVTVNGETVFTNIANGEFAEADVPAGTTEVALLPSGSTKDPILGPLDVALQASTLSMIYAYGNPRDGSMNVISHTAALAPDGSVQPSRIDTGSAGLVTAPVSEIDDPRGDGNALLAGLLTTLVVVAGASLARHLLRRPGTPRRTAG